MGERHSVMRLMSFPSHPMFSAWIWQFFLSHSHPRSPTGYIAIIWHHLAFLLLAWFTSTQFQGPWNLDPMSYSPLCAYSYLWALYTTGVQSFIYWTELSCWKLVYIIDWMNSNLLLQKIFYPNFPYSIIPFTFSMLFHQTRKCRWTQLLGYSSFFLLN